MLAELGVRLHSTTQLSTIPNTVSWRTTHTVAGIRYVEPVYFAAVLRFNCGNLLAPQAAEPSKGPCVINPESSPRLLCRIFVMPKLRIEV